MDKPRFLGLNYNNLRKALYLIFFGIDNGKCNDFESPNYRYIIPMQGNYDNPLNEESEKIMEGIKPKDTFIQFWIEQDESLTQDDYYIDEQNEGFNRQKCVASILVRIIGKEAEQWIRVFRHLVKRSNVAEIWSGVCNATKLEFTSPILPRRVDFFGKSNAIAFDVRFKLRYDEVISTNWSPLEGIDFTFEDDIKVEGSIPITEE